MNSAKLTLTSLRHYWKWHLGLVVGVALASAILSGSLVVGDSVRATLRKIGEERLGRAHSGLVGGDRWFTEQLVRHAGDDLGVTAAPVALLRGSITDSDGSVRANGINVIGVDEGFWELSPGGAAPDGWIDDDAVILNEPLARRLGVGPGDAVVVRVELPSMLSRDAALSGSTEDSETTAAIRREVTAVAGSDAFGRFSLRSEQAVPLNVYLPLARVQDRVEQPERVNLALLGENPQDGLEAVRSAFTSRWSLDDAALGLRAVDSSAEWEISTLRVFLDPEVAAKALEAGGEGSQGVLTYLVNSITAPASETPTPYSMVAAVDSSRESLFPDGIEETEIVINQWLAEDLDAAPGDVLTLAYYVSDEGRTLREESADFTATRILPMDDPAVNPQWTPDFPGISDTDNCRDWDPGFEIDLDRIRDKDEDYWDAHRGTPKGFISLAAGQKLWSSRFGNLTAIRIPQENISEANLRSALLAKLTLGDAGLNVVNFRAMASGAVAESLDFGGLFASLSFFLVLAALVLTGLLFLFSIEERSAQIGLLLAVGFTRRAVRRLFVREATVLVAVGATLGLAAGSLYTKAALWGLSSEWAGAVAGADIIYHVSVPTLVVGAGVTMVLGVGIAWLAARRIGKASPHRLVAGGRVGEPRFAGGSGGRRPVLKSKPGLGGIAAILGGGALLAIAPNLSAAELPMAFFGAGFLFLCAGLAFFGIALSRLGGSDRPARSIGSLGLRSAVRRPGRSLAVAGIMAAGVFLVTAVNAFRLSSEADPDRPDSGTGGFDFVAAASLPVYNALDSDAAIEQFGLDDSAVEDAEIVSIRQSEGDDASCLNLNRAQEPIVLGVDPDAFARRGSFRFVKTTDDLRLGETASRWKILDAKLPENTIPAVADQSTVLWALGLSLGNELVYETAEGVTFRLRIVGMLATSVLQGRLLVSEENFIRMFPAAGGYRLFLVDAPEGTESESAELLTRQLRGRGLETISATDQLDEFNEVQNTYLTIFTTLGGFGVLLGTLGLGVIVARNVMERRAELGVLQAVGFRKGSLRRLVVAEHWFLHVSGMALGIAAAAIAVWPTLFAPGAAVPLDFLGAIALAILAAGLVFCWVAAAAALRAPLMTSIRTE